MLETIFILAIALIPMFVCKYIAERQGRDKWFGCLMGFLFGWFAVLGYLIAGDKQK